MPLIIPVVVLIISMYLIVGPIVDKPTIEYLYAAAFIFGGMVFYVPFVHYGLHLKFMGKNSTSLALVLNKSLLGVGSLIYRYDIVPYTRVSYTLI